MNNQIMESDIKKLREAKGLSQNELAELVNTSQVQIYRLENGKRVLKKDLAVKLARALDTDAASLMGLGKAEVARPKTKKNSRV